MNSLWNCEVVFFLECWLKETTSSQPKMFPVTPYASMAQVGQGWPQGTCSALATRSCVSQHPTQAFGGLWSPSRLRKAASNHCPCIAVSAVPDRPQMHHHADRIATLLDIFPVIHPSTTYRLKFTALRWELGNIGSRVRYACCSVRLNSIDASEMGWLYLDLPLL